jgi:hypothetical protein
MPDEPWLRGINTAWKPVPANKRQAVQTAVSAGEFQNAFTWAFYLKASARRHDGILLHPEKMLLVPVAE